jgi:hypothetical protein
MQNAIISMIVKAMIPIITRLLKENYGLWGDKFFDMIEDAIADSKTTLDDKLLPVIKTLRVLMNIPDLPDE